MGTGIQAQVWKLTICVCCLLPAVFLYPELQPPDTSYLPPIYGKGLCSVLLSLLLSPYSSVCCGYICTSHDSVLVIGRTRRLCVGTRDNFKVQSHKRGNSRCGGSSRTNGAHADSE